MISLSDRYQLYQQMEQSTHAMFFHHYTVSDAQLHLHSTNFPDTHMLDLFLKEHDVAARIVTLLGQEHSMVIFTGNIGTMWGVVFYRGEHCDNEMSSDENQADSVSTDSVPADSVSAETSLATDVFLLGPAVTVSFPIQWIEKQLRENPSRQETYKYFTNSIQYRMTLRGILSQLPVVSESEFAHELIRLNACVNQTPLGFSDILFVGQERELEELPSSSDMQQTWVIEQELMDKVRNGDDNYADLKNRASFLSKGVIMDPKLSLLQAQFSGVTLATLASRAAISGGVTPGEAYRLQNLYVNELAHATSETEVATIDQKMFRDFVQLSRLRKSQENLTPRIRRCKEFLEAHYMEPIGVEDLAREVGYSRYYLSRNFKEEVGIGINEYLRRLRIERAKVLLRGTDQDIDEIAELLQFSSGSYFARQFARETGITPSEYRKQC